MWRSARIRLRPLASAEEWRPARRGRPEGPSGRSLVMRRCCPGSLQPSGEAHHWALSPAERQRSQEPGIAGVHVRNGQSGLNGGSVRDAQTRSTRTLTGQDIGPAVQLPREANYVRLPAAHHRLDLLDQNHPTVLGCLANREVTGQVALERASSRYDTDVMESYTLGLDNTIAPGVVLAAEPSPYYRRH